MFLQYITLVKLCIHFFAIPPKTAKYCAGQALFAGARGMFSHFCKINSCAAGIFCVILTPSIGVI